MSRFFDIGLVQSSFLNRSFGRLMAALLLGVLILTPSGCAVHANDLTAANTPEYAWSLKSGLFTVGAEESVHVLITDVSEAEAGAAVVVRFFNRSSELLREVEGMVFPGEPVEAKLAASELGDGNRSALRLEVVLLSDEITLEPVTTVEVRHAGSFAIVTDYSCAGPLERQPVVFYCPEWVATHLAVPGGP